MGNLDLVNGSVLVLDFDGKVLSLSEGLEAEDLRRKERGRKVRTRRGGKRGRTGGGRGGRTNGDLVSGLDEVVIRSLGEPERKHTYSGRVRKKERESAKSLTVEEDASSEERRKEEEKKHRAHPASSSWSRGFERTIER